MREVVEREKKQHQKKTEVPARSNKNSLFFLPHATSALQARMNETINTNKITTTTGSSLINHKKSHIIHRINNNPLKTHKMRKSGLIIAISLLIISTVSASSSDLNCKLRFNINQHTTNEAEILSNVQHSLLQYDHSVKINSLENSKHDVLSVSYSAFKSFGPALKFGLFLVRIEKTISKISTFQRLKFSLTLF